MKRTVITIDSASRYIFSFFTINAIQEIFMELKKIRISETIKNVLLINDSSSLTKKLELIAARINKAIIELK